MHGERRTRRTIIACTVLALLVPQISLAWFAIPPGAGITTVYDTQDTYFSTYGGPASQTEWQDNYGGSNPIRIKGTECPAGLKFDLSPYRGQLVVAAELHLCKGSTEAATSLAASTISVDWDQSNACWRYKALPGTEWAFPQSDMSAVAYGNLGSLTCFGCTRSNTFRTYTNGSNTWYALVIDKSLIQAMMIADDQPGGLAITDARWHGDFGLNPSVYSVRAGQTLQPRLYVQFAAQTDFNPPTTVGNLTAATGMDNGSVVLSFTAPSDAVDTKAFGYYVRYSTGTDFNTATKVDRWRIPRPGAPGAQQALLIEGLTPGQAYNFFVQAYDSAGNTSTVTTKAFTVPAAVATPTLANGGLTAADPTGKSVRTDSGNKMYYFAASEVAKVMSTNGRLYNGTADDNYKKANMVWDSGTNTISLLGCRNEMVGCQVVLGRVGSSLNNISITPGNLAGPGGSTIAANPNIELFQMHYVGSSGSMYADAAIPLASPFPTTFNIPDTNHNSGGAYQPVYMDVYIPQSANPGDYTGTITVTASSMSPVTINLKVHVSALMIPDYPTFILDCNGYFNQWDFGPDYSATCLKYFQTVHKHRGVPNTLPYGWSGSISADRCPTLTGNGPSMHASDWSTFDNKYGRFFTSDPTKSAFNIAKNYTGPGANTPITHFYTTFHEMWPQSMLDATYGFDAPAGGAAMGPAYWDSLLVNKQYSTIFSTMPDSWTGFPSGYKQANTNVASDWFQHAHNNGWTKTAFEIFLNDKYYYIEQGTTHALWAMEENEAADDFRVDGYLHQAWRDGQVASGVTDVPWHFRIDISDRYGQNWGQLNNRINWWDPNSSTADWYWPQIKYRKYHLDADKPEDWITYGGGAGLGDGAMTNIKLVLRRWCQGINGVLPWWDCYQTNWGTGNDLSIIYSGQNVPGYGTYSGPIISSRLKQLRQAEQIVELLNLWAGVSGMNRNRARDSLYAKYGDASFGYGFTTLSETTIYQMRADLIAQLEPSLPATPSSPGPANAATGVSTSATLSWGAAASGVTFDVYFGTANPPVSRVATGQSAATFAPGALQTSTTYYWQIIARNSLGYVNGPVWSFTTQGAPPAPSSPSPANGATAVATSTALSWTGAGSGITFDVYLNTFNPPTTKVGANLSAGTFTPGGLQPGTLYYWKVVAKNGGGQTPGSVWSFTTQAAPSAPSNPSPANGATGVAISTALSWTGEGSGITFDVYLDTATSPVTKVATGGSAASLAPTLSSGTRYYWKIIAINGVGQTSGPVWSFATALLGDINTDGYVNVGDLQLLVAAWCTTNTTTPPSANWNPSADLNGDGFVNVGDLLLLVANWGKSAP